MPRLNVPHDVEATGAEKIDANQLYRILKISLSGVFCLCEVGRIGVFHQSDLYTPAMHSTRGQLLCVALLALLGMAWSFDAPLLMWSGSEYVTGLFLDFLSKVGRILSVHLNFGKMECSSIQYPTDTAYYSLTEPSKLTNMFPYAVFALFLFSFAATLPVRTSKSKTPLRSTTSTLSFPSSLPSKSRIWYEKELSIRVSVCGVFCLFSDF